MNNDKLNDNNNDKNNNDDGKIELIMKKSSKSSPKWELLDCKTIKFCVENRFINNDDNNLNDDDEIIQQTSNINKQKLIHIFKLNNYDNELISTTNIIKQHQHQKKLIDNRLQIRQPFKILTDIWGVLISYKFRQILYKYIDDNLENYLRKNFNNLNIKLYIEQLIKRTDNDLINYKDMPIINKNNDDELIKSIVNNINYRRNNKKLMYNLDVIFNEIWNDGYKNKTLRPLAFDDIIDNFKKWTTDPYYIKIYTFASGSIEMQKLFLSATNIGNISNYITSGFDTFHQYKYDTKKYLSVLSSLSERDAKNLFYFTDSPNKGRAARLSGMTVFIIRRPGNRHYNQDELNTFTIIDNFNQFEFIEFADAANC